MMFIAMALAGTALAAENPQNETVQTWKNGQGDQIVLVEDRRAPIVELQLQFPAGLWDQWAQEAHLQEAFVIQLYDTGGELRKRANGLATTVSLYVGDESSTLEMRFLKQDTEEAFQLAKDVLANADFDQEELKRMKKNRKIEWKGQTKDPSFVGRQAVAEALFEDAADVRRIDFTEPPEVLAETGLLAEARDRLVQTPGRIIGIAGDMSRAEAEKLVEGLLPAPAGEPNPAPSLFSEVKTVSAGRAGSHQVGMENLTQVYFFYYRDLIPYDSPDYPAFLIADHVLGGHFYSRLYEALRHDDGDTYGVGTREWMNGHHPGMYVIETFTRTDNAAEMEDKLKSVVEIFHAEGITEEELQAATSNLRGRQLRSQQAPTQLLNELLWELEQEIPQDFERAAVEKAGNLTLEEVNGFIGRFYLPAEFSTLRVEPE